jgi:hypothetical protein
MNKYNIEFTKRASWGLISSITYLIHCNNLYKYNNVPLSSTISQKYRTKKKIESCKRSDETQIKANPSQ